MTKIEASPQEDLQVPGITFSDGPAGRRAVIAGTGLDVWEVIAAWQSSARDFHQLRQNYLWLSELQLRAALTYYEAYPHAIDARLEREAQWTPERVASDYAEYFCRGSKHTSS